jgi:biopolymer transport protein ExbB
VVSFLHEGWQPRERVPLMSGVCFNPYGCEWTVGYLWRSMNQFGRLDVIELGLMLAYTLVVVGLGSYRYHIARHQTRAFARDATRAFERGAFDEVISIAAQNPRSPVATMVAAGVTAFAMAPLQFTLSEAIDAAGRAFQRSQRMFAANLSIGLGTLKSIAYTAPFLGLVGTCFRILSAFRGIGMEKHAALAMMSSDVAKALIATATGIVVAVPAVWSYNHLRARGEVLESEMSNMALEAITHLTAYPQWQSQRSYSVAGSKNFISAANAAAP